jgi:hypothetical protein
MQASLNEAASDIDRQYRKYPILWLLSFLYVALGVALLTLAIQCNTSFSCTYAQQGTMLWFGIMILVSLVPFIIVPNILRYTLNCLYERPKLSPVKKMSPLSLAQGSPKSTPKPPSSPRPKHALKSFREFTQAA